MAVTFGTNSDETLTGTDGADTIDGLAGSDLLLGGGGDDELRGAGGMAGSQNESPGADTLSGGTGADILRGGGGDDVYQFARGDGNDTIIDEYIYTAVNSFGLVLYTSDQDAGNDEISFGAGIVLDDLWIDMVGDE
ncbi:MAG: hypothetical protein HOH65_19800, partial [Rhodospirillaceae bacterium]|nr:hypothetical protein [Rhodospirillaceae bacterium]